MLAFPDILSLGGPFCGFAPELRDGAVFMEDHLYLGVFVKVDTFFFFRIWVAAKKAEFGWCF
jgi:hypothetical protein